VRAFLFRQSAYFTIPDGLDHGADLYCSYRACRAEGCKFRYCATCKAPAARRNFRKRHGHGEAKPKSNTVPATKTPPAPATGTTNAMMQQVFHDADAAPAAAPAPSSKVRPRSGDEEEEMGPDDLNKCWDALLASRPDVKAQAHMDAWMLRLSALSARMHRQKSRKNCEGDGVGGGGRGLAAVIIK